MRIGTLRYTLLFRSRLMSQPGNVVCFSGWFHAFIRNVLQQTGFRSDQYSPTYR